MPYKNKEDRKKNRLESYYKKKENRLCTNCGIKLTDEVRLCEKCLGISRRLTKEKKVRRIKNGKCRECGRPMIEDLIGVTRCIICRENRNMNQKLNKELTRGF